VSVDRPDVEVVSRHSSGRCVLSLTQPGLFFSPLTTVNEGSCFIPSRPRQTTTDAAHVGILLGTLAVLLSQLPQASREDPASLSPRYLYKLLCCSNEN
jgi:hypothetical protein